MEEIIPREVTAAIRSRITVNIPHVASPVNRLTRARNHIYLHNMHITQIAHHVRIVLPFLVAAILTGCGTYDQITNSGGGHDVYLRIWAHSDIQPRSLEEKSHYETAVADIAARVPGIRMAIVAGDLVHRREGASEYHRWLADLRRGSKIPFWFEIAGNHDQNDIAAYYKYTGKPLHYAIAVGNILIILMSDEIRSAVTDISDGAFEWWRGLVVENQARILVTVTHGALQGSGLPSTINPTMRIAGSHRFFEVLRTHPVDLWISGHSHLPSLFAGKIARPHGIRTLFVDVSSIHKSRFSPIESSVLAIRTGSDRMNIMLRDHEAGRFIRSRSAVVRLRTRLEWDGADPKIVSTCP